MNGYVVDSCRGADILLAGDEDAACKATVVDSPSPVAKAEALGGARAASDTPPASSVRGPIFDVPSTQALRYEWRSVASSRPFLRMRLGSHSRIGGETPFETSTLRVRSQPAMSAPLSLSLSLSLSLYIYIYVYIHTYINEEPRLRVLGRDRRATITEGDLRANLLRILVWAQEESTIRAARHVDRELIPAVAVFETAQDVAPLAAGGSHKPFERDEEPLSRPFARLLDIALLWAKTERLQPGLKLLLDSAHHCVLLRHRHDDGAIHLAVKSARDAERLPRALMHHCQSLLHVVHAPAERALLGVAAVQVAGALGKLPNVLAELFLRSARCFVDLGANDGHDAIAQSLCSRVDHECRAAPLSEAIFARGNEGANRAEARRPSRARAAARSGQTPSWLLWARRK